MKKFIAIRIPYKKGWLFTLALAVLVLLFGSIAFVFIDEGMIGAAVGCFVIVFLTILGYSFKAIYGIYIGKRHFVAIEQSTVKVLKLNDISRITVKFSNECVSCLVKMKSQAEHVVVFDGIYLGSSLLLPDSISLKLSKEFVDRSIERLLECELVKIQDFYH